MAITRNQVNTALRYLGTNAAAGLTFFTVLGALKPEDAQLIVQQSQIIYDAIQDIIGAFAKMWPALFALISFVLLKFGVSASSVQGMLGNIFKEATTGSNASQAEAQKGLAETAVTAINATPVAMSTPEVRAANTEAKATLLQGTITMPEVVNAPVIVVNDPALARAVPSPTVVADTHTTGP